jgi:AMP nucleosidase
MERIYREGYYPTITVTRSWSAHNPVISGEMAEPAAFRWFLIRELTKLIRMGAEITISPSRSRLELSDPRLMEQLDEQEWDITQKKMFLFPPERIELSLNRLEHYTGTTADHFQRNILFTNYNMHIEEFRRMYPDCVGPERDVQMPAYHAVMPDNRGFSLINIGVGPSNAKTITDHVAVLRPDCIVMIGHCGGLRNHQEIGDFVLATGFLRNDRVLDDILPLNIPIIPNFVLNRFLMEVLERNARAYRLGTVFTTANRNWEFMKARTVQEIHLSRSVAIDMESATVATNSYRYRIPFATLLSVSDKPLHGKPKLSGPAREFYLTSKQLHLQIVIDAIRISREVYPEGLPNASIRATNEPLFGGPKD